MKAAAAKKQTSLSPAMLRLANCFADAVVDDLLKQHERELESVPKKQKRSGPSARRRTRARA